MLIIGAGYTGLTCAREAQAYMQEAVQYVKDLIEKEELDSDHEHTGMLRVAYIDMTPGNLLRYFGVKLIESALKSVDFYEKNSLIKREVEYTFPVGF